MVERSFPNCTANYLTLEYFAIVLQLLCTLERKNEACPLGVSNPNIQSRILAGNRADPKPVLALDECSLSTAQQSGFLSNRFLPR